MILPEAKVFVNDPYIKEIHLLHKKVAYHYCFSKRKKRKKADSNITKTDNAIKFFYLTGGA